MAKLLFCPHCGATMAVSRAACGRCGRELTFEDDAGVEITTEEHNRRTRRITRLGVLLGLAIGVLVLVVAATLVQRLRTGRAQTPSLSDTLRTLSDQDDDQGPRPVPAVVAQPAAADAAPPAAEPDLDRALATGLEALRRQPDDTIALNSVGQVLVAQGDPARAIEYLERAVRLQPGVADFQFNLAAAYDRADKPHRAAAVLRELTNLRPDDGRVRHNLGLALRRLGRHDDAAAEFRKAVALLPTQAEGWLGLGLSLDALGLSAEAAEAFDRFLALAPDDPQADILKRRVVQLRANRPEPGTAPGPKR